MFWLGLWARLGGKIVGVVLLFPAIVWLLNGLNTLLKRGLYSYTSLPPLPLRIHTLTLLSATAFYLAVFLTVKPYRPFKNLLISCSLILLSLAIYEFVYGVFMIYTSTLIPRLPPPPLPKPHRPHLLPFGPFEGSILVLFAEVPLLHFLNWRLCFLAYDKKRLFLFFSCFFGFIVAMLTLHYEGFFIQMHLYLRRRIVGDPHNPLWAFSKILCIWMFYPLLTTHLKVRKVFL